MPALIQLCAGLIFRTLIGSMVFGLTFLRRTYQRIQHLNDMDETISGLRSSPTSSSISICTEINTSRNITAAALAIENTHDIPLTHESIEENNDNVMRNEEQADTNNENISGVDENFIENQSRRAHNSSYILVNTNDENASAGNQNNADEIIVATLAFVLECCDMCVII